MTHRQRICTKRNETDEIEIPAFEAKIKDAI